MSATRRCTACSISLNLAPVRLFMRLAINLRLVLALALGLALTVLCLSFTSGPASTKAQSAELHVCLAGCPYASVQAAVDAANDGDMIKVATSIYNDIHVRPRNDVTTTGVVTQIVYVSKTVTIQGGYTTTNW